MGSSNKASELALDALCRDHRRASQLMNLLTERLDGLTAATSCDLEIARSVFQYMVDFVDERHHAREDQLIDLIRMRDPEAAELVGMTDLEHEKLRQEGNRILDELSRTTEGTWSTDHLVVHALHEYSDHLLAHFRHEEHKLFAVAKNALRTEDWRTIYETGLASGDPVFGEDVEDDYRALFDIFVNQVREIGSPAPRHATATAAVLLESTTAITSGIGAIHSALRNGMLDVMRANLDGALSLFNARDASEFLNRAVGWSKSSLREANAASRQVFEAVEHAARATIAPVGEAMDAEYRSFSTSHRTDSTAASWQAHVVNLMLRATVKRFSSTPQAIKYEIPTKNIEIPRTAIERFIPELASDVRVETVEFDHSFGEFISIEGAETRCTVLFFPGGGFIMRPTQAHRLMAARMARKLGARVLLVHYRLAPEYRFPKGLNDCIEAYRYLLAQGTRADKIVVMGDSAGGGMALSTLVSVRDAGLPLPLAGVLLSPVSDLSYAGLSRQHNSWNDPTLPNDENRFITQVYLGDETPVDHPLASPLFSDLSSLPPIIIQVGSIEILLDDALRVAAKIRGTGGECECEVWHDMPHDWMLFGMLPEARKALRRIVSFIEKQVEKRALADCVGK
ncbi:hypothetical protein GCM10011494_25280 [Novosphingobium endophyticum]|uniref:Alpha/beta hydrolase n=1 Tax=Novosphingobium endophyticum TaxID=1955250 RepID=A0A916TVZ2_9SPHN|nr:alpha/beta hydrolase fold domain-containing protein [Novosphingobium endophyticum]GGC05638.1 hypothetical protein GCM10011494_25280 [Novosphingobium endophyticum]